MLSLSAGLAHLLVTACGDSETDTSSAQTDTASRSTPATTGSGDTVSSAATNGAADATDANSTTDAAGVTNQQPDQPSSPVDQYLADAATLVSAVTAASERVAAQLDHADVESADWRAQTAADLRELAAILDAAANLTAPPEYATQHQQLLEATGKYSWATELLASGVETLDLNTISDAAALLANASAEFATAQAALAG